MSGRTRLRRLRRRNARWMWIGRNEGWRELEEKVEMEVEQTEKTVEPESGRHAYGKLPPTVGCAEDLTLCGWLGPWGRAIWGTLVGQLESRWIPSVW